MPSPLPHWQAAEPDVDINDPVTLDYYTQLTAFKSSREPKTLIFPPDLPPEHRRVIHTLAHHIGLLHTTHGSGEQRQVHVQRAAQGSKVTSPYQIFGDGHHGQQQRAASVSLDHPNLPFSCKYSVTGFGFFANYLTD